MSSRTKRTKKIKVNAKRQLQIIRLQLLVLLTVVALSRCATVTETVVTPRLSRPQTVALLELPRIHSEEFLLYNTDGRYTVYYDTAHRQAAWVAYVLTREDVSTKGSERSNRFRPDPAVKSRGWSAARDADYRNSGYDRGHLLPSADRNSSQKENDATFLLSNISPQHPALNRRIWNMLEAEVRRMAERLDTLYIVTGPMINDSCSGIGNGISIPSHYFKALLAWNGEKYIAAGFVIPNTGQHEDSFWNYAVTVDRAEELSGLDFFCNLPNLLEEEAEGYFDPKEWR